MHVMKNPKTVRAIGDFGHQVVIGAFEPSVEDCFPTKTHFGLVQDAAFLYGTFRDEAGTLYAAFRRVQYDISLPLSLQTTVDGGQLQMHPSSGKGFSGPVVQRLEKGEHVAESLPGLRGHGFCIRRSLQSVTWSEGDFLSVEGRMIGPGMHWYDPGRDGGGLYLSHILYGQGMVLGKRVEGFFGWDLIYLPAGTAWMSSPYFHGLEVAWFTMGNKYEDGSFEVGQICYGTENWTFAMICNEQGPVVMTTDVSAEVEFKENTFPGVVHYQIDGERWDWVADPRGEMPYYAKRPPIYRPSEGLCTRVQERRKVVHGLGWIDCFNDGRGGFG